MKKHGAILILIVLALVAVGAAGCRSRTDRSEGTVLLSVSDFSGLPVSVSLRTGQSRLKPRLQNAVRLVRRDPGAVEDQAETRRDNGKRVRFQKELSEQQQKVIDAIAAAPAEPSFSELLESTNVSASVVRTLEKRGLVEVFAREHGRERVAYAVNLRHRGDVSEDEPVVSPLFHQPQEEPEV